MEVAGFAARRRCALSSGGEQLLDFAGPASAFEAANDQLENPAYRLSVLAADEGTVTNSLGIATAAALLEFVFIVLISLLQLKLIRPKWSY